MDRVRSMLEGLLTPEGVVDLEGAGSKRDVLVRLGTSACEAAGVPEPQRAGVLDALWDREQILSTGIGLGIAVPHVRHASVTREVMRVGRARHGLAFDAIDGQPVHAVFTILMPAGNHRRHVQVLGAIAAAVKDDARRASVFEAPDAATFVARLLGP
jgi:nitrogen PTS system EIIA component